MKEKYLPAITEGLNNLGKTLKSIFDGFFVKGEDGKYTFSATAGLKNIFAKIKLAFTDWGASLKAGFFDEEGNFQLMAGLKNAVGEFGKLAAVFAVGSLFMLALAPRTFFGTLWVGKKLLGGILGVGGTVAKKFGKLFVSMTGFGTSLTDTGTTMKNKLSASKKTGVFRRGLGGITGRFGRLFRFFGKRGLIGLMAGAGVIMATKLASSGKEGGLFTKIGTSFGKLFTKVGEFGAKIGTAVSGMTRGLAYSLSDGVFSIAKGVGTKFGTLFGKVGEFGAKIGTTVTNMGTAVKNSTVFTTAATKFSTLFGKVSSFGSSISTTVKGMGETLTNSTVFKTVSAGFSSLFGVLSDFGTKIAATAAKASAKVAKVAADAAASIAKIGSKVAAPAAKLSKTALAALRGTGEFAFKPVAKAAKLVTGGGRGTVVEQAGERAKYLKGLSPNKSAAKIGTELSEAALKKSFLKTGLGVAGKAVPVVGAAVGLGLGVWRALKGDFVGAGGEFVGIFAPSLVGLPIDLGLAARDIYYDQFGIYPEKEKDLKLAKSRMGQITAFLKKQKPKAEVKPADNPFSGKVNRMDLQSGSSRNDRSPNLVPNMAYDYNDDGTLSRGERINASRRGLTDGPLMIAPVTNISNTSNSNTSVMNRTLVMQDPLLRSAINAM